MRTCIEDLTKRGILSEKEDQIEELLQLQGEFCRSIPCFYMNCHTLQNQLLHTNLVVTQRTTEDLTNILKEGKHCFWIACNCVTLSLAKKENRSERQMYASLAREELYEKRTSNPQRPWELLINSLPRSWLFVYKFDVFQISVKQFVKQIFSTMQKTDGMWEICFPKKSLVHCLYYFYGLAFVVIKLLVLELLSYGLGLWQGIAVYAATVGWRHSKWTTRV